MLVQQDWSADQPFKVWDIETGSAAHQVGRQKICTLRARLRSVSPANSHPHMEATSMVSVLAAPFQKPQSAASLQMEMHESEQGPRLPSMAIFADVTMSSQAQ